MALKLTKYSYKALRKLSVQDRISAAQDREVGQWLLSLLTPSQFVDLFPRYYRDRLPDISGFMIAMPTSMSAAKQRAVEEQLNNTVSGSAAGSNYKAGGWKERYQRDVDEQRKASVSRRGQVPPPQLSPEQRKAFDELKSAPMAADDPRAKMLANLSDQQLKESGIEKYKEGDKEFFKRTTKTFSEEEVKKSMEQYRPTYTLSANDLSDRVVNVIAGEAYSKNRESVDAVINNMLNRVGTKTYGPSGDLLAVATAPGQYAGLRHAKQEEAEFIRERIQAIASGTVPDNTNGSNEYRAAWYTGPWGQKHANAPVVGGNRFAFNPQGGVGPYSANKDPITTDYSEKSMQLARERLARRLEEKQMTSLAAYTQAELPAPGSPEAAELVDNSKNAQTVADRIKEKFGHLENPQCVALAKAYVGASESVTEWRRGTNVMDGTLRPGTPIATFMDRAGNPSSRYDNGGTGAPGNHTTHAAVFLDYVRVNGKITGIRVMEQYSTSGGAKEKVYPVGGYGTSNAANYHSINNASGMPLGQHNPMLQVSPAQTPPSAKDINKPPTPVAGTHGDNTPQVKTPEVVNKPEEDKKKKVEGKVEFAPKEQNPVEKPPVPTPANPAPQVKTPEVVNKPEEKKAAPVVKTNSTGGINKLNTEQISAYPIGGLKGDNAVYVNKYQQPLFTANTNEPVTIDPKNKTATVEPNRKDRKVSATQNNPMENMMSEFTQSINELSNRFNENRQAPQRQDKPDPFIPEGDGGSWLNNLNKLTEKPFLSVASERAFHRAQGKVKDNGTGTDHFSHGNHS